MHGDCTYKVTKMIYVFSSKMDTRVIREKISTYRKHIDEKTHHYI